MAEVVGLVFGGIALASLYSTSKDAFEFFELSSSYPQDSELAVTKLFLLRARFLQWAESANIMNPGLEAEELRKHWFSEGETLYHSLSEISTIFGNAKILSHKYGLGRHKRAVMGVSSTASSSRVREIESRVGPRKQLQSSTFSFKRRAVWAISDKKKFDSLISDLDFLITNLEKINWRLNIHSQGPDPDLFKRLIQLFGPAEAQELYTVSMSAPSKKNPLSNIRAPLSSKSGPKVDGSSSNNEPKSGQNISEGNKTSDEAKHLVGNYDSSSADNKAVNNEAKGKSIQLTGNGTQETLKAILEHNQHSKG